MAAELLTDASRALDSNASPYAGATWSFYATGGLTPQAVYADADLSTSLGSVVTADSGGRFVPIYFDASLQYRGICKDAAGTTLPGMDIDPINTGLMSQLSNPTGAQQIGYGATTVAGALDDQADTISSLEGAVGDIDPRLSSQNLRTVPTIISTPLPTVRVWDVNGFGPGGVNHNVDAYTLFRSEFGSVMGTIGNPINDKYVDWYNGSDSNNGRGTSPYKTIQKALEVADGDIWLLNDSEEILDFDGTERTVAGGTVARAMVIRGFNGRKSIIGAGTKASDATWTETAPGSTVWTFTNTPAKQAEAIIYAADGDWKNGVLIPFRGTGSNGADAISKAGATFDGWSQVTANGDIYLRYLADIDINAEKAKFFIAYSGAKHIIKGASLYFEDVDFLGGGGIAVEDSAVTPSTFNATVFMRNCDVYFANDKGIQPDDDSLVLLQDCKFNRNSGDGVGPYGNSVTLMVDCYANYNGSLRTYSGVVAPARNRQGLSTHEDSFAAAIGCDFQNNYGQNCANTTDTATTLTSWLVGCDFRNPWEGDGQRSDNTISGFTCLETYGKAYVDSCLTGGPTSEYGWIVGSGTGYSYRNQLQGTLGTGSGGILLYDPFGALP